MNLCVYTYKCRLELGVLRDSSIAFKDKQSHKIFKNYIVSNCWLVLNNYLMKYVWKELKRIFFSHLYIKCSFVRFYIFLHFYFKFLSFQIEDFETSMTRFLLFSKDCKVIYLRHICIWSNHHNFAILNFNTTTRRTLKTSSMWSSPKNFKLNISTHFKAIIQWIFLWYLSTSFVKKKF